jgi:hypothetical protein
LEGIVVDPKKIKAIIEWPVPKDVANIQSFMGINKSCENPQRRENTLDQGLIKAAKIPKGGKRPGQKWINCICEEKGRCKVCRERNFQLSCCYEHYRLSVRQEELCGNQIVLLL